MDSEEVIDRYVAPCFVNGLEAYDDEISLGMEENMILNDFAVKLCLEHELRRGNRVVKKELIVALRGEIYFVNFIINPKEDDIEAGVVLGRSFMLLTKGIANFGNKTFIIYPKLDPFLENIKGVEVLTFVCKMGKSSRNKRHQLEKFQLIYFDMGPSMSTGKPLTQEEAKKEALAISICETYSLLEEERLVIKTIAYSDKYKKILDVICIDKMKLDGEMKKEEEYAIINIQKRCIKRKGGSWSICDPDPTGSLETIKSDSDDEEDYAIQRNKFRAPMYRPKLAQNLNCNDPMDQSLALQAVLNPFRKVCVGKKVDSFLGSLPVALHHVDRKPDYTWCFNRKEDTDGQWHAEIRLTDPYGNIYDQGFAAKKITMKLSKDHKLSDIILWERITMKPDHHDPNALDNTRRLAQLLPRLIYSPSVVDWNVLNQMGCGEAIDEMLMIKLCVVGTNEEIFTSEAWTNAFNIDERIYSELCHDFYSTYEFDETLLEYAKSLGLYNSKEIEEEGFHVYFHGGLRTEENFNAQEYWFSISREENLSLSRIHASTIQNPVLRVLHKMITYEWVCECFLVDNGWMKRKGAGSQKESMICCGQFITKIARRKNLPTEEVLNSLSAPIYCRALDTATLKELIDSDGRLIPEAPEPGVPRVAIPRPPRASMQNLYERMGNMEIPKGRLRGCLIGSLITGT
nr:hypothetical protein [Tanacetum cinerariifolium]